MTPDVRSELRTGLVVFAGSLLAAIPVGILWWAIAPKQRLVTRADGIFLVGGESETAIAADGRFAICAATAGLVLALVVFARMRMARLGPLLGLAVGGLLGAVVAWRIGAQLGPGDIQDTAKGLAVGTQFDGPLTLSARGVLFLWPLAATVAYFALTAGLEPKDRDDEDGHRFPVTVLRPGYAIGQVDDTFGRIEIGQLSTDEVRGVRFASSRWRQGYDSASVDAALATMASQLERVSSTEPGDQSARPSLG